MTAILCFFVSVGFCIKRETINIHPLLRMKSNQCQKKIQTLRGVLLLHLFFVWFGFRSLLLAFCLSIGVYPLNPILIYLTCLIVYCLVLLSFLAWIFLLRMESLCWKEGEPKINLLDCLSCSNLLRNNSYYANYLVVDSISIQEKVSITFRSDLYYRYEAWHGMIGVMWYSTSR